MWKGGPRAAQARLVRSGGSARAHARRGLRSRRGTDRRLRALLLVHARRRNVPRRRGNGSRDRRTGARGARVRVPSRDRRPCGARTRHRRRVARRASVRRSRVRSLSARRAVKARLSTDGGARGNPGPAAYGYVLEAGDGHVLDARGEAIGTATNNVAEYRGLVAGMQKAAELGVTELEVVSDSELLVKQMRGDYRVKNQALRVLWEEANDLERRFARVSYTAVRRAHNELADRLVNEALDAET